MLNESYVNAIRLNPAAADAARAEVRDLLTWNPVAVNGVVIQHAWKLQDGYRISYRDALIVSAAKIASCGFMITEDLQYGQDLDGVEVVNPFLRKPESVL